ncbi:hypothetical protein [Streptomyces sp. NPDC001978]|uniref:hypothetical protein n=1 Tax=Streptomyces sp. NPDC001978 TaxID=3364627 RepID=UPI0036BE8F2D
MDVAHTGLGRYMESWAPTSVNETDDLGPLPAAALCALLDLPGPVAATGDPLPPLWQWLYFLHWPPQRDLGDDGHPRDGHFLPPVPHRQRMIAGGRCEITRPLYLGAPAERVTCLGAASVKQGTTGELLFVTIRSEYRQHGSTCLIEEQDIVYRSGRSAAQHPSSLDTTATPSSAEPWQLPLHPDPALLFRFSALTANAHRIHYDAPYAQGEEGYPGLVVHGPLLALAMLELVRRNAPDRPIRSLAYRLRRPAFAGARLLASGTAAEGHAELRVATHCEPRHATAEVSFA